MNIQALIRERVLFLDGDMGAMLAAAGFEAGKLPEEMNLTHPDVLTGIHKAFVEAGADIVTANTFQAGELKLAHSSYAVETIIAVGVRNAKASGAKYTALALGPIGKAMRPKGNLPFQRAYEIFRRQVNAGAKAGADLILIENLTDLYEAKAAVLAAKESCSLPVFCSLAFGAGRRTAMGADAMTAAITLSGLGADAIGASCALGPTELVPVTDMLLRYSRAPVFVRPSAGKAMTPEKFASPMMGMVMGGARILGGGAGATPEHIAALSKSVFGVPYEEPHRARYTAATSGKRTTLFRGVTLIGERLNPANPIMEAALRGGDMEQIANQAMAQSVAGSGILDVSVALPGTDEQEALPRMVSELQGVVDIPLQVGSADPVAVEKAVRLYNGKPVIHAMNGRAESLMSILPIAKKYGALVVALTMNEEGVPATAEGRLAIAKKIMAMAECEGVPREDVLIDCLALPASVQQEQAAETIRAVRLVKAELGVKTVLGVSNVSEGFKGRESLNAVFLAAALGAGLDAPILDPLSEKNKEVVDGFRLLTGATS